jgi:hypothetical protein
MIDNNLLNDIRLIINDGKTRLISVVNSALTFTYWNIGKRINQDILKNERAEYGKQIVTTLSSKLVSEYGKSFEARNLRRMMQFAEIFPDVEIVVPLARHLSWSHFLILIPIKNKDVRTFYAQKAADEK